VCQSDPDVVDPTDRLTPEAYAAAWQANQARLWSLALGLLGHRADAEDLVQEAVVVGLQKLDQYQPGTRFAAWMGQILRNLAMNHRRKNARRKTNPSAELDAVEDPDTNRLLNPSVISQDNNAEYGDELADDLGLDDDLHEALSTLNPEARACLLLRTVHGMGYDEIGACVGLPSGTAMSHVHRSRQRLRSMLSTPSPETKP